MLLFSPHRPVAVFIRTVAQVVTMESQGEFDIRMEILLGSETSWLDPEAAEFPKSTIERYYGPCIDWTRADLILPCAKPVDEPPVQFVVSTPPVMIVHEQPVVITPRRDWYFDASDPPDPPSGGRRRPKHLCSSCGHFEAHQINGLDNCRCRCMKKGYTCIAS